MEAQKLTQVSKRITIAKIAIGACVAYLVLLILLHIIKPEVTPTWQTLSIYSRGAWGWLGQIAYCLLGVTHLLLFAALRGQMRSRYGKVGLILLVIAGIGGIFGGIGVSDPLNTPQASMTPSGQVHAIGAGLEIWGAPFAALLISLNLLRKNTVWKAERVTLLSVIALPLIGWALFMGSGATAGGHVGPGDIIGVMNRIAILAYMIWQIVIARAMIRVKTNA